MKAAAGRSPPGAGGAPPALAQARSLLLQRDFYLFTAERLAAPRAPAPHRPAPALALA